MDELDEILKNIRKKKLRRLENMQIDQIALVDRGANRKKFLIYKQDGPPDNFAAYAIMEIQHSSEGLGRLLTDMLSTKETLLKLPEDVMKKMIKALAAVAESARGLDDIMRGVAKARAITLEAPATGIPEADIQKIQIAMADLKKEVGKPTGAEKFKELLGDFTIIDIPKED